MALPMSPAQAAILGRRRPAPVATVNAPQAGGFPITPAQVAVLTGQSPVGAPPAAPQGPATPAALSPFSADPMADFLLNRANRPGDIRTGTGLLGRLAALGVGRKLEAENTAGAQQRAMDLIETLPEEQRDVARLAVLSGNPEGAVQAILQAQQITARSEEAEKARGFEAEQTQAKQEFSADQATRDRNLRRAIESEDLALRQRIFETETAIDRQKMAIEAAETELPDYKEANKLQDDFRAESKDFKTIANAFRRVQVSIEDPSPAGDLSLIFNYMKILDPNSVVRESEFATAQNTGSVPQRVWSVYNQVLEGTRLSPPQREDFGRKASQLFIKQREGQEALENEFIGLANNRKVPVSDFLVDYVGDLREVEPLEITQSAPEEAETPALPPGFELEQ
jgi:hypothetical protein